MDEAELVLIGLAVTLVLAAVERHYPQVSWRVLAGVLVVGFAGLTLKVLRLDIVADGYDFLNTNLGVAVGLGLTELRAIGAHL